LIGALQLLCENADENGLSAKTVDDLSWCGYSMTMELKIATEEIESYAARAPR
jgi:hypothetical protein